MADDFVFSAAGVMDAGKDLPVKETAVSAMLEICHLSLSQKPLNENIGLLLRLTKTNSNTSIRS